MIQLATLEHDMVRVLIVSFLNPTGSWDIELEYTDFRLHAVRYVIYGLLAHIFFAFGSVAIQHG
jgi:hypothetical protein